MNLFHLVFVSAILAASSQIFAQATRPPPPQQYNPKPHTMQAPDGRWWHFAYGRQYVYNANSRQWREVRAQAQHRPQGQPPPPPGSGGGSGGGGVVRPGQPGSR